MGGLTIQSSPSESGWGSTHGTGVESHGMTNSGESGKAVLDDVKAVFAIVVLHVGMVHAILGQNAAELEEAFNWVLEARLHMQ